MMKQRLIVVILASLATGLLLGGCSLSGAPPTALAIVVRGGAYLPAILEAPSGSAVRLTLDNQDDVAHQLAIYDIPLATRGGGDQSMAGMNHGTSGPDPTEGMAPVHIMAAAGSQQTVEFSPTQAGAYAYKCIEPGHAETGVLTIVR